jgi:predicted DNA-binding transcriptional regulator AlpA
MAERIISQRETDQRTGTERSTRRRMEAKGEFPRRFQITENGATGYLESEVEAWIASRAADRTPTTRTAAAVAARRIKRSEALPPLPPAYGRADNLAGAEPPGRHRGRLRRAADAVN